MHEKEREGDMINPDQMFERLEIKLKMNSGNFEIVFKCRKSEMCDVLHSKQDFTYICGIASIL